jgi:hypothetical protein
MKKLKQILITSSDFETFGKRLWRIVPVDAYKPVKISKEKSKWKHFDTLEDIIEYYELKNIKSTDSSHEFLADIEGEDYKENDVDDIDGFADYLDMFLKGGGWEDGYGNHFDGNGNFQYRIDYYTGSKVYTQMTSENTVYDPILKQSVLKNEQSNIHIIMNKFPKWLSDKTMLKVKELWNTPTTPYSYPCLRAMELVKLEAKKHEYLIDIVRSKEIIEQYCL